MPVWPQLLAFGPKAGYCLLQFQGRQDVFSLLDCHLERGALRVCIASSQLVRGPRPLAGQVEPIEGNPIFSGQRAVTEGMRSQAERTVLLNQGRRLELVWGFRDGVKNHASAHSGFAAP